MNSEALSAAAFGAASQALVAHSGTTLPAMGGRPGGQDVDLEDLFSLRRPKNVLSGASSGLQSVAKGACRLHVRAAQRSGLANSHTPRRPCLAARADVAQPRAVRLCPSVSR